LGGSSDNLALRREVPRFYASVLSATAKLMLTAKYSHEYVIGSSKYFQKQSRCVHNDHNYIYQLSETVTKIASANTMFSQNAFSNLRICPLATQHDSEQ